MSISASGYEQETIETGSLAAIAGGFTSVVCMPNTNPVIDNVETLRLIEKGKACFLPYLCDGKHHKCSGRIEPHSELKKEGIVAITDDGKSVANARVYMSDAAGKGTGSSGRRSL